MNHPPCRSMGRDDSYLCRNPESGDEVVLAVDIRTLEVVYSLNGGPSQPVTERFLDLPAGHAAKAILLEFLRSCKPTEAEEETLP